MARITILDICFDYFAPISGSVQVRFSKLASKKRGKKEL
jgi:hypothetical protein